MRSKTQFPTVSMMLFILLITSGSVLAAEPSITLEDLVGVWRICYEPGLDGVSEIDSAYLVFLPGDRYIRMSDPLDSPRVTETGTYSIVESGLVMRGAIRQAPDGSTAGGRYYGPQSYRYERKRPVVFGIEDRASPVPRSVLLSSKNANYAFAKIY